MALIEKEGEMSDDKYMIRFWTLVAILIVGAIALATFGVNQC